MQSQERIKKKKKKKEKCGGEERQKKRGKCMREGGCVEKFGVVLGLG